LRAAARVKSGHIEARDNSWRTPRVIEVSVDTEAD
jgi:hypothetical protein